jgi:hypothetical protein
MYLYQNFSSQSISPYKILIQKVAMWKKISKYSSSSLFWSCSDKDVIFWISRRSSKYLAFPNLIEIVFVKNYYFSYVHIYAKLLNDY